MLVIRGAIGTLAIIMRGNCGGTVGRGGGGGVGGETDFSIVEDVNG